MITTIADRIWQARQDRSLIEPTTSHGPDFTLEQAYAVNQVLQIRLEALGATPTGHKLGLTNQATWESLGIQGPFISRLYTNTVQFATNNHAKVSLAPLAQPRLEPEVVFKLRSPLPKSNDPETLLGAIEWFALGFEIVDVHYPGWKFKPADLIADFGAHATLIVGTPQSPNQLRELAATLAACNCELSCDGGLVGSGGGSMVAGSPALALGWLNRTLEQLGRAPTKAGEIITTGSMTAAPDVQAGQTWTAQVHGLDLPMLTIEF